MILLQQVDNFWIPSYGSQELAVLEIEHGDAWDVVLVKDSETEIVLVFPDGYEHTADRFREYTPKKKVLVHGSKKYKKIQKKSF